MWGFAKAPECEDQEGEINDHGADQFAFSFRCTVCAKLADDVLNYRST